MDEVTEIPASEHENYAAASDIPDNSKENKVESPKNAGDDNASSASSPSHSTSGIVSASSPGSQRDFYSHVSGAGDGKTTLQTSEDARSINLIDVSMDDGSIQGPVVVRSSVTEFEENNKYGVSLRDISKDWSNKVQKLNRTISTVLKHIPDPDKVDVTIGKTTIHRDKSVVLAWNKKLQKFDDSIDSGLLSSPGGDDVKFVETQEGVVLYCAIRLKDVFQDANDTETSATKDVFRQTCLSSDPMIPNINLDEFELGDKVKRRFRTVERKSPRSRKSPRRSPRKGSPDKTRKNGQERDAESEGTYSSSSSLGDDDYITETENEEYRHRRGVGIRDDDDYRIMRSRPGETGNGKKSVTWRKEIDRRESSTDRADASSKVGTNGLKGTSPRRGSREGNGMSPRRRGSSESKGTDEDSSRGGSRRGSKERSPRGKDLDHRKVGSDIDLSVEQDSHDEEGISNGVTFGARSRSLRKEEDDTDSRSYRKEYEREWQFKYASSDDNALSDERILYLKLQDSPKSHEKERLIRRRRTALRRRRRRAERLKSGEPFDGQRSDVEGEAKDRMPRTPQEKRRQNELRRKYLNADVDTIVDEEYREHDPDYDRDGDQRHDTCFLPFEGYGENYDGPVGVLTSQLPDGSSTAGTLFTSVNIHRRRSSLAFWGFYDLQRNLTGI